MNDLHDDPTAHRLSTLLQERVATLHPDLEQRAATALRAGQRIKRRRRLTVATTTLGGVAAVTVLGMQVWSPLSTPGGSEPGPDAASSGDHATAEEECLTALKALQHVRERHGTPAVPSPGTTEPTVIVPEDGPLAPGRLLPPCTDAAPAAPVSLSAPGWECEPVGDAEFTCSNGTESALVTLHQADLRDALAADADPGTFIGEVSDGWFVTVATSPTDAAAAAELGEQLTWG